MKTLLHTGRRGFLKRAVFSTGLFAAFNVASTSAGPAIGPSSVLTTMFVSATSPRLGGTVSVSVVLRRLDGINQGLASHTVHFHASAGTTASYYLGFRRTDSNGRASFTFPARLFPRPGTYVVVAEMNPLPVGDRGVACPLPFARFTITP